jgi:flagellar biosynthesis protein FlhG
VQDQADGLRRMTGKNSTTKPSRKTKTIVVTSGKGGVGKSNFSLNFSLALRQMGFQVGILDADLGLANLDVLMGVTAPYNITHLISGQKTLKEIILKCPGGVFLIPGGSGIVSALIDERKLRVLLESLPVLDEYFDYLIIDTGAGISKQVLSFALAAEEVVVVTTPDPTSLADAFNIIKVIHRGSADLPIGVVVNQADSTRHGEEVFSKLHKVSRNFLEKDLYLIGIIPFDTTVSKAVRAQVPLLLYEKNAKSSLAIKRAASDYLMQGNLKASIPGKEAGGLKSLLGKMARMLR